MSDLDDKIALNSRIAVLETLMVEQDKRHKKMESKVDAMYEVIMQLRGAKWFGLLIAASVGFIISNISSIVHFLQGK
jgi:tetrahydromethanopterin S-methyltransferase subunit G